MGEDRVSLEAFVRASPPTTRHYERIPLAWGVRPRRHLLFLWRPVSCCGTEGHHLRSAPPRWFAGGGVGVRVSHSGPGPPSPEWVSLPPNWGGESDLRSGSSSFCPSRGAFPPYRRGIGIRQHPWRAPSLLVVGAAARSLGLPETAPHLSSAWGQGYQFPTPSRGHPPLMLWGG